MGNLKNIAVLVPRYLLGTGARTGKAACILGIFYPFFGSWVLFWYFMGTSGVHQAMGHWWIYV